MNFAPKVGPLVAELLSGVTALLIIYFDFHGLSLREFDELTSGAIGVLVVIASIIGTSFDAVRNQIEWVWDGLAERELRSFFFRADETRLASLDQYFWSFYLLDIDMAIAIVLSLIATISLLAAKVIPARPHAWVISILLFLMAACFANDGRLLRQEIKKLLSEEAE